MTYDHPIQSWQKITCTCWGFLNQCFWFPNFVSILANSTRLFFWCVLNCLLLRFQWDIHILDVQQRYSCLLEVIIAHKVGNFWKQSYHTIHKVAVTLVYLVLILNCLNSWNFQVWKSNCGYQVAWECEHCIQELDNIRQSCCTDMGSTNCKDMISRVYSLLLHLCDCMFCDVLLNLQVMWFYCIITTNEYRRERFHLANKFSQCGFVLSEHCLRFVMMYWWWM